MNTSPALRERMARVSEPGEGTMWETAQALTSPPSAAASPAERERD